MFLMIDNYDSFTYNLYALFSECGAELDIVKNDDIIAGGPVRRHHHFARPVFAEKFGHHAPVYQRIPRDASRSSACAWACRPWPILSDTASSGRGP